MLWYQVLGMVDHTGTVSVTCALPVCCAVRTLCQWYPYTLACAMFKPRALAILAAHGWSLMQQVLGWFLSAYEN